MQNCKLNIGKLHKHKKMMVNGGTLERPVSITVDVMLDWS